MEKEYEAYFESLSEGDEVLSFAEFKEALPAPNAVSWTFWKTLRLMLAAAPTTSCLSAPTGLSLMTYRKKVYWMTPGVTATNLARMD